MAMEIQIERRAGYALKIKTPAKPRLFQREKSFFGPGFRLNSRLKLD
jgi:hypothetical protein